MDRRVTEKRKTLKAQDNICVVPLKRKLQKNMYILQSVHVFRNYLVRGNVNYYFHERKV